MEEEFELELKQPALSLARSLSILVTPGLSKNEASNSFAIRKFSGPEPLKRCACLGWPSGTESPCQGGPEGFPLRGVPKPPHCSISRCHATVLFSMVRMDRLMLRER